MLKGQGSQGATARILPDAERRQLMSHSVAMTAALAGWFTCAMFASVAYSWTFYYVLALIVAGRELTRDRLYGGRPLSAAKPFSVPAAKRFQHVAADSS
jgi:hypothetical protein